MAFVESDLVGKDLLSQFKASVNLKEKQRNDGEMLFAEYFGASDALKLILDSGRDVSEAEMKKLENNFDVSRAMLFNFLKHVKVLDTRES